MWSKVLLCFVVFAFAVFITSSDAVHGGEMSHRSSSQGEESIPEADSSIRADASSALNHSNNGTCDESFVCFKNTDCGSRGGRCTGSYIGTCNCDACVDRRPCDNDDAACGGLRGACKDGHCDCIDAFVQHGLGGYVDALRDLCNIRTCDATSDECLGLPCRVGRCTC